MKHLWLLLLCGCGENPAREPAQNTCGEEAECLAQSAYENTEDVIVILCRDGSLVAVPQSDTDFYCITSTVCD